MTTVALEADARISQLMERVDQGESVTITKDGIAIARLIPVPAEKRMDVHEAVAGLLEFRKAHRLVGETVLDLIAEARGDLPRTE